MLCLLVWVVCGHLAHEIDKRSPKLPGEDNINYLRCIVLGPIMLFIVVITYFTEPQDED